MGLHHQFASFPFSRNRKDIRQHRRIDIEKGAYIIEIQIGNVIVAYFFYLLLAYAFFLLPMPYGAIMTRFFIPFCLCFLQFLFSFIRERKNGNALLISYLTFMMFIILSYTLTNIIGEIYSLWNSALVLTILFDLFSFVICRWQIPANISSMEIPHFILQILLNLGALTSMGFVEYIFNTGYRNMLGIPLLWITIGIYLVVLCSYVLYARITMERKRSIESQGIFFKKQIAESMTRLTEENIEEIRRLRHDIKGQYQLIGYYLERKDYAALQEYCSQMQEASFNALHFTDCGNDAISVVINLEERKARDKGFVIDHEISVPPRKISISDYDISHLLMNLLENAIEALEMDKPKDLTIKLKISLKENTLFILTQNAYSGNEKERFSETTSKEDKDFHGYGIKIIKQIVRKYDGIYDRSTANGVYRVEIGIPCHEVNEKEVSQ